MKRKGAYSRYSLLKRFSKRGIILVKGKNRYLSFDRDVQILEYIRFNLEYSKCNLKYLDKFGINYIVHDLKIKYMIRYMDDYILIHYDKNYLKKCLLDISEKLEKENKL